MVLIKGVARANSVPLRVRAAGRDGNRIDQTVLRAFGLKRPEATCSELVPPSKCGSEAVIRRIVRPGGSGYGCELVAV